MKLQDGTPVDQKNGVVSVTDKQGSVVTLDGAMAHAISTGVMDVNEGFFFQRELEHIKARSYDVLYPALKARQLFPVSNEAGKGVETITYRTYDQVGRAKILGSGVDDMPRADVSGRETSRPVKSLGLSYGYTLDEIQASQLTGKALDQRRASAVRRGVEETMNDLTFFGDATAGIVGLFDNPDITSGAVAGAVWTAKTPDEILTDINTLMSDIFNSTNMVEQPNTLLISPAQWSHIMTTARSPNSDTTIAQYVVNNSYYIKSMDDIIAVNELAQVNNPGIAGDAMVAYDRNPDKLQLEIPVELEMLPVQHRNLEFIIPTRARFSGLHVYYPRSVSIATGI